MAGMGKLLVLTGLGIAGLGALLWAGSAMPWLRLGRLPGDIHVEREGFSFFFPIVTMLLISALATLLFWLAGAFRR